MHNRSRASLSELQKACLGVESLEGLTAHTHLLGVGSAGEEGLWCRPQVLDEEHSCRLPVPAETAAVTQSSPQHLPSGAAAHTICISSLLLQRKLILNCQVARGVKLF